MKYKLIKIVCLTFLMLFCFSINTHAFDVYIFGVNVEYVKERNYKEVVLGALTSILVHSAGHYLYANTHGMTIHQNGFRENITNDDTKENRECAQVGYLLQHTIGLILTTIPKTRHTDFTKGYTDMALLQTTIMTIIDGNNHGDFVTSDKYGGNKTIEFALFETIGVYNYIKSNFKEIK